MPRTITAAQNRAQDFHKSDALAQTNKKSNDYLLFCMVQKTFFSQDLKLETKIPGTFFRFHIVLYMAAEKFGEKIIRSSWSSRKRFF